MRVFFKVFVFAVFAVLQLSFFCYAAPSSKNFSKKINKKIFLKEPFKKPVVGEKLLFETFWMGVPVGEGSLEVKEKTVIRGREAYHLVAVAKTNDFLTKIYPIYDEIHSFVDAENFNTLEFRKTVREGRYRADERIQYDYEHKKIIYESLLNKSKKEFPLQGGVQDFLSAFFWFRVQAVKIGDRVRTKINDEDKDWDLELHVLRTEMKELHGERVLETFVVEPKTSYKGIFERRGRAWVHFTSDERRVPVWITMTTPFGPVTGVLKSAL